MGDLGNEVNDDVLQKSFQKYTSFIKAKVVRDKRTNKTKGECPGDAATGAENYFLQTLARHTAMCMARLNHRLTHPCLQLLCDSAVFRSMGLVKALRGADPLKCCCSIPQAAANLQCRLRLCELHRPNRGRKGLERDGRQVRGQPPLQAAQVHLGRAHRPAADKQEEAQGQP